MTEYQCKIVVKDSKPPVWWRCLIPSMLSFSSLSLILDEMTGTNGAAGFFFAMRNQALIWEPTKNDPLRSNIYHSAYSAAYTPFLSIVHLGKTINYHSGGRILRIEIEEAVSLSLPPSFTVLKTSRNLNALESEYRLRQRFHFSCPEEPSGQCRNDLENSQQNGYIQIGLLHTGPNSPETYQPSDWLRMKSLADMLDSYISRNSPSKPETMRDLLATTKPEKIREIAKLHGIPVPEDKPVDRIVQELTDHLLKPDTVHACFSLLEDWEMDAFEELFHAGPFSQEITEDQENDLNLLTEIGYVFIRNHRIATLPSELRELCSDIFTVEFSEHRRKVGWIASFLDVVFPVYYAILPMRKLSRICRRNKSPVISPDEVEALVRCIPENFCRFNIEGDMIYARSLFRDTEQLNYVRDVQADKPYFIMKENEIEEFLEYGYPYSDPCYRRFREYLIQNMHLEDEMADDLLHHLLLAIAFGRKLEDQLAVFEKNNVMLNKARIQKVTNLLMALHGHTPSFYNRGYTPERLEEVWGDPM